MISFWHSSLWLRVVCCDIIWTGGQAKTLMFVHISPDAESFGETMSTLKFAERVATVELGAARSNKESGEIQVLKDQVHKPRTVDSIIFAHFR